MWVRTMCELKRAYDKADKAKQAELFKAVESFVDAGGSVFVLKVKLEQFKAEQQLAEAC
jgi:hypothetical protein